MVPAAMTNFGGGQQYGQQQQGINTNIEWVQGGATSVNAIQLPNNTMWAFWDNNEDVIYVKTVDSNGRLSLDTYDITLRDGTKREEPTTDYVTRAQFDELSEQFTKQLADLTKKLNDFKSKVGQGKKEAK